MELKQSLLEIGKIVAGVKKMSDKYIKSTLHHGRKAETDEVENEILIGCKSIDQRNFCKFIRGNY